MCPDLEPQHCKTLSLAARVCLFQPFHFKREETGTQRREVNQTAKGQPADEQGRNQSSSVFSLPFELFPLNGSW